GVPVLRDDENADLDLARRQRDLLVEVGADVLHAARDRRRMNPDLVGTEDAAAPGDELIEHRGLFGREFFRRQIEQAVHDFVLDVGRQAWWASVAVRKFARILGSLGANFRTKA